MIRQLLNILTATMHCGRCKKTVVVKPGTMTCSECGL